MGTVTIGGASYDVYGTLAGAVTHWQAGLGAPAVAWGDANEAARSKALVNAYRLLERQRWLTEYNTFLLRDAVVKIQEASYEIAGVLLVDPSLLTSETSGKNIKSVGGAGVPTVEFFNPTLGITGRFPINIQELLADYLAGESGGVVSGSFSSGTDGTQTSTAGDVTGYFTYGLTKSLP